MKLLPAVVAELDDVVLIAMALGVHNEAEQGVLLLLAIDHHPTPEEPVAAVLTGRPNALALPEGSPKSQPEAHGAQTHLLDWARSKHSTLVGLRFTLWNMAV